MAIQFGGFAKAITITNFDTVPPNKPLLHMHVLAWQLAERW